MFFLINCDDGKLGIRHATDLTSEEQNKALAKSANIDDLVERKGVLETADNQQKRITREPIKFTPSVYEAKKAKIARKKQTTKHDDKENASKRKKNERGDKENALAQGGKQNVNKKNRSAEESDDSSSESSLDLSNDEEGEEEPPPKTQEKRRTPEPEKCRTPELEKRRTPELEKRRTPELEKRRTPELETRRTPEPETSVVVEKEKEESFIKTKNKTLKVVETGKEPTVTDIDIDSIEGSLDDDEDLFGPNCAEDNMILISNNIYCKRSCLQDAAKSQSATSVARRLLQGIVKADVLKRCTITGEARKGSKAPVRKLHTRAKDTTISYALAKHRKMIKTRKWLPGRKEITYCIVEDSLRQFLGELKSN